MAGLASNTPLFQRMDRWVGGAACLFCECLRFLGGLLPTSGSSGRKGLLFVKLAEQGSTVLAGAAIGDAVQKFGRENVYFLVFDENRFILDAHDLIPRENVLTIDTSSLKTIVLSSLRRLVQIRRLRIEALIDLEFFSRATAAFSFLTGIPRRVGFHAYFMEGPWRGNLFTHRPRYNPHIHTSSTFRSLVAALDMPPDAFPQFRWVPPDPRIFEPPRFRASAAEVEAMTSLVSAHCGGRPRALVLLNANASDLLPLRRWADANYISLAKRVLELSPDVFVAFTDPWPKRRHHRRRLFGPEFLDVLWSRLETGGTIQVATDHLDYFAVIRKQLSGDPRFREVPHLMRSADEQTDFELIFRGQGLPIGECAFEALPAESLRACPSLRITLQC